jgi:hypothetical protein
VVAEKMNISCRYGIKCLFLQPIKEFTIMAYYIKPIPTLTGEAAQRFNDRAAEVEANPGSIDFTEQVKIARKILAEAHLGY